MNLEDKSLALGSLQDALAKCGFKLPAWRVRDIVDRMDRGHGGLTFEEFTKICTDQKSRDFSSSFKKKLSRNETVEKLGGMSEASSEGKRFLIASKHSKFQYLIKSQIIKRNDKFF